MKTKLTKGQRVWICWFHHDRSGNPVAKVKERIFDHDIPNYLGRMGFRYALRPVGTPPDPRPDSYCTAYMPEHVHLTEVEARTELQVRILEHITKLEALLPYQDKSKGGAQ